MYIKTSCSVIVEVSNKCEITEVFRRTSKYLLFFCLEKCILYLEIFLNSSKGGMNMGFAVTFKALSDPVRRDILMMLKKERLSAGEIGSHFDMTGATISYHLSILKKADLVFEHKEKNFIYYELNVSVVEEVMLWLAGLKGDDEDGED